MPAGVRFFAEHQPFTALIDTLRGLLFGTNVGSSAIAALAWCTGIAVLGLVWSIKAWSRERAERPS